MKNVVKYGVLSATLAASGLVAPIQSSANEGAWDYKCGAGQQFYKDGTPRYICEEEPNETWKQAKEVVVPPSYGDSLESKRVISLVGYEESSTSIDWWKIILPIERGNMSWESVSDKGRGQVFIYDEKVKNIIPESEYTYKYGKYTGNVFYYGTYGEFDRNYFVDLEFKANPIADNPHEPNDNFYPEYGQVEYATVKANELVNSSWSSEYDRYDNFVINSAAKGTLNVEINYSDYEFSRWTHRDAYIGYKVYAEKTDGSWTTIYSKAIIGMPKQQFAFKVEVEQEGLTGKYLLNLSNAGFYDEKYSFKMSFAPASGEPQPEPKPEPKPEPEPEPEPEPKPEPKPEPEPEKPVDPSPFERIGGSDRYETNRLLNADIGDHTLDHVILASGRNYPDALAGGALSKSKNGTVLLVQERESILTATIKEAKRLLKPTGKVLILGSNGAVSTDIESSMKKAGLTTKRLSGASRVETAIAIAKEVNSDPKEIFLVDGFEFADALSIAPVSAKLQQPILMIQFPDRLPKSLESYLKDSNIEKVNIIGGTFAVGAEVEKSLIAKGYKVNRINGTKRTETSLAVAKAYFPNAKAFGLASGWDFPDALSGSSFAYRQDIPVLLTHSSGIQQSVIDWTLLNDKKAYFMGGTLALPAELERSYR